MTTASERRALVVVAAIAALGVVARVIKAREARPAATAAEMLALDSQIARVRSARGVQTGRLLAHDAPADRQRKPRNPCYITIGA